MPKIALIQMLVEGGKPEANLRRACDCISEAARQGAQIVVLPEALNLGWTHPFTFAEAEFIPDGPGCTALRDAARQFQLYLCAGLVERDVRQTFNSAVLIGPAGDLLLRHRKLNELEIGHPYYAQGTQLAVASTPLGNLGVMICADAFARGQIVSRALGLMGADIILSPCAWAVPANHDQTREPYGQLWLDNYCPVAREFKLWIASVSNVGWLTAGPWQGRKCIGCSMLIDPSGNRILSGPYGAAAEAILYADIEFGARPARGDAWWHK